MTFKDLHYYVPIPKVNPPPPPLPGAALLLCWPAVSVVAAVQATLYPPMPMSAGCSVSDTRLMVSDRASNPFLDHTTHHSVLMVIHMHRSEPVCNIFLGSVAVTVNCIYLRISKDFLWRSPDDISIRLFNDTECEDMLRWSFDYNSGGLGCRRRQWARSTCTRRATRPCWSCWWASAGPSAPGSSPASWGSAGPARPPSWTSLLAERQVRHIASLSCFPATLLLLLLQDRQCLATSLLACWVCSCCREND